MTLAEFRLEDRYRAASGSVAMSGVQALLRVLIDQLQADKRSGLDTAAFVSGYRGSPLGGVDTVMEGSRQELTANRITFMPGLNEDLAATAVWGSQLAVRNFETTYDGVLGMWYGKAPGLDRSGDPIRHANLSGVDPKGGVVMVVGDDPSSKSSTIPSSSETALAHLETPVFYPGNVQEVIDYGRMAYELSRYSGLWTSLKIVTNVADGYATVQVGPDRVHVEHPEWEWNGRRWQHTQEDNLVGPVALAAEEEFFDGRLEAARRFISHNSLNTLAAGPGEPGRAQVGIVAAGKTYYDLRSALTRLGLDDDAMHRRGVRVFKPTVLWPLDQTSLRQFASGLDQVLVIEEKRPFLETYVRDALYGMANPPLVLGKRGQDGSRWIPGHNELDADIIGRLLRPQLASVLGEDALAPIVEPRKTIPVAAAPAAGAANRMAGFCSGCPHNTSTWVPDGSEAGGGIGCHGMAFFTPERATKGITQMGGEGAQWVGAAPFVTMNHRFQNIGDGTLHHSGSLAIRQAVASGVNITYKILYNGAVAMTGGQDVDGQMQVPELTRALEAEGVAKIMVLADDPEKYGREPRFAPRVEVWHRSRLDEAQRLLRDVEGCTVLVYDQACAAELRRDRKRGKVVDPAMRVFINERVCEGCGDCGVKSSCMSVHPVDTEFGRKTQIHQSSCNKDYTCLDGDCPAFVEVIPGAPEVRGGARTGANQVTLAADEVPEPERLDQGDVLLMGVGGTGVVTINQLLATAALLDAKSAHALDQTGLSQKGGSVVSNLRIRSGDQPTEPEANKIGEGQADAYLVFDILTGVSPVNLAKADRAKTVAVVSSSKIPTAAMVRNTDVEFPEWQPLRQTLETSTRADRNVYVDAEALAHDLFGSHMPANVIVLGAAYQQGVIPISAEAIEKAIGINGVAVDLNTQAFRVGRKLAHTPEWLLTVSGAADTAAPAPKLPHQAKAKELAAKVPEPSPDLAELLAVRIPDLIGYQNVAWARKYVEVVARVRKAELSLGDEDGLSVAVARYLHKLMTYKDEYEVARLYRDKEFRSAVAAEFGPQTKVTYKLHPPMLRRLGVDHKIGFGRSGELAFGALARLKHLRGTKADPFARTQHRQRERALIGEYIEAIDRVLGSLDRDRLSHVIELAELPDMVRGYELIKDGNIDRYQARLAQILSVLVD